VAEEPKKKVEEAKKPEERKVFKTTDPKPNASGQPLPSVQTINSPISLLSLNNSSNGLSKKPTPQPSNLNLGGND